MNGNKENARVVKTYVCGCGEVNKFSLETDFNVVEVRIDAHCQRCGKEISISVENFFRSSGNGNGSSYPQQSNQPSSYNPNSTEYNNQNYSGSNSQVSYYPASSDSSSSNSSNPVDQAGMQEFNFDALTSAAGLMAVPSTETPETIAQDDNNINSFTSEIMQDVDVGSNVSEIVESSPLAANILQTPARKIISETRNEEEKDLLFEQEESNFGEDASSDEQEAFIDLFGRL